MQEHADAKTPPSGRYNAEPGNLPRKARLSRQLASSGLSPNPEPHSKISKLLRQEKPRFATGLTQKLTPQCGRRKPSVRLLPPPKEMITQNKRSHRFHHRHRPG